MKRFIAVAAALVLSGCGLPPVVTAISYALDGMSLLSTGKSVSDHALSAAAKQDCAMWRVIKDEKVCRDFRAGKKSEFVLAAERWERGTEIVGLTEPEPFVVRGSDRRPVMLALVDPVVLPQFTGDGGKTATWRDAELGIRLPPGPIADQLVAIERAPNLDLLARVSAGAPWLLPVGSMPIEAIERARERARPPTFRAPPTDLYATANRYASLGPTRAWKRAASPGRVLVLGSFTRLANAKHLARRWSGSGYRPAIVGARVGGKTFHRVIIAVPGGDVDRHRRRLAALGHEVWAADVCRSGTPARNAGRRCIVPPAALGR